VRYEPGQFNRLHHDGVFRPRTVFVYLNDLPDDDDGETYFPRLGLKITPTQARGTVRIEAHLGGPRHSEAPAGCGAALPVQLRISWSVGAVKSPA
jgi:hypothetical protein